MVALDRYETRIHPRRSVSVAKIAIVLILLRWIAGVIENLGITFLSEAIALAGLAVMFAVFCFRPVVPKNIQILVAGLILLLFGCALSVVNNSASELVAGLKLMLLLAFYLFIGLFLWNRFDAADQIVVSKFLVLFLVFGGVLAVSQVMIVGGFVEAGREGEIRAIGSDVHPVSFGIQIVIAATGLFILHVLGLRIQRAILILTIVLTCTALYLTLARTAWAMAAIILITIALGSGGILRSVCMGALISFLAAIFLFSAARFEDLASLPIFFQQLEFGNISFDHRYIDNSVAWRIVNWSYGLEQSIQKPWLGHGPGSSALASSFSLEMHNILLEMFFELGVFGLAGILIVFHGLWIVHRNVRRNISNNAVAAATIRGLGFAMLAAVLFSTSLVDQLMSVVLYLLILRTTEAVATRGN